MTNQTAVQFVSHKISEGLDLPQICEEMMEACLATSSDLVSLGCDNMTVIIVALLNGKPKQEWAAAVKTRYDASSDKYKAKTQEDINGGQGVN